MRNVLETTSDFAPCASVALMRSVYVRFGRCSSESLTVKRPPSVRETDRLRTTLPFLPSSLIETFAGSDSRSCSLTRLALPRWRRETTCGALMTVAFGRTFPAGGGDDGGLAAAVVVNV